MNSHPTCSNAFGNFRLGLAVALFGLLPAITNAASDFDVVRDFSLNGNPNGVWSYGWQSSPAGSFTPVTHALSTTQGAGVAEQIWELGAGTAPYFLHFPLSNTGTGISDGGFGQFPPGTLIVIAGGGAPQNLASVRFTAPSNGNYQVGVAVRSYLDGGPAGDTDFHVARNGVELFGQFLPGVASAVYTNILSLTAGDTIDLAVGRGADNNNYGSGLKIAAVITPTTNAPPLSAGTNCIGVPNSLVSWWAGEGTGNDLASTNNGIMEGGIGFMPGKVGQAFSFDGTNDAIRVPASSSLNVGAGEGLTIEMWIKPANLSSPQAMLEWSDGTSAVGLHFWIASSSPGSLYANLISTGGAAHPISSAPGILSTGVFQHVALTYDKSSGIARLYRNGAPVAEANVGSLNLETRPDILIGRRLQEAGTRFRGEMDEISLYRHALSAQGIASINHVGSFGKCRDNPPPVVAGDFNVVRDFSLNGNPNGVWSYGWQSSPAGSFTPVTHALSTTQGAGVAEQIWELGAGTAPYFLHFPLSNTGTGISDGGFGQFPPGTLIVIAGVGAPHNLASVRFTAPSNSNYHVGAAVRSYLDGGPAGDTDFHVARNGVELFGQFLPGVASAVYTNILSLTAGDTIDLAVGRGADNNNYGSGLKIAAVITPTTNAPTVTNPPPPVVAGDFNVVRDFSLNGNPNGVWSYGWQSNPAGSFTPVTHALSTTQGAGVAEQIWELNAGTAPYFLHFPLSNTGTGISDGGFGQFPPGTLIVIAGVGAPHNLASVRFTAPSNSNYHVGAAVRSYLDGGPAGDTDFHVARNGVELFGQFLPGVASAVYTNILSLTAGDTIDLAVGRGADNNNYGSGLKIAAVITPTTNAPTVTNPPPPVVAGDFNVVRDFSLNGNPNGVWSYGWQSNPAGSFTPVTHALSTTQGAGVAEQIWELNAGTAPYFLHFPLSNTGTGISDGGFGQFPPGTLIVIAGVGAPHNLASVRFTAPSNSNYHVGAAVRSYLDGGPAGDTDFHVARNGVELFGQFLPGVASAVYTNILSLTAGDTIDLAVGRGVDNNNYGSGLKIAAVITPTTNAPTIVTNPPPIVYDDFNAGRDFSAGANPGGVWSYGWKNTIGGAFSPLTWLITPNCDNGVPVTGWLLSSYGQPAVYCNTSSNVGSINYGQSILPPGTIWIHPGINGRPENYSAIRFTAPSNGNYHVGVAVAPLSTGNLASDTDFHVVQNGAELFGRFLGTRDSASFSNIVALNASDTLEFVGGRGADGNEYGSSLRVSVLIAPTTNAPTVITNVPPSGPVPVPSGIVAWWSLEGNGNDASAHNHALTIQGAPVFDSGEVGQAMIFDGVDDYGQAAAHSELDLGANDGLTIEMWANPSSISAPQPLVEWTDNISIVGLHFWLSGGGSLFANVIDRNGVAHQVSSAAGALAPNTFTHVALTFSKASGLAKLYAGGQILTTANIGNITPETRTGLHVGWRPLGGGQYRFGGKLDEISLYSRELTTSEIAAIAQAGTAGKLNTNSVPPPMTNGPVIVTQPAPFQSVEVGDTATFSVNVSGTPPLTFQWLFDGVPISGATSAILVLSNVQPSSAGSYRVIVSNSAGSASSSASTLNVSQGEIGGTIIFGNNPTNGVYDVGGSNFVPAGGSIVAALFAGPSSTTLQQIGGVVAFVSPGRFVGGTRSVSGMSAGQTAYVQVKVWDSAYGSTYEQAIAGGSKYGASPIFTSVLGGGVQVPGSLAVMPSFVLILPPAAAPQIAGQPVSQSVLLGQSAAINVSATGGGLTYQWFHDGSAKPGATMPALNFAHGQKSDAGDYFVVVSNSGGSVTSQVATLSVNVPRTLAVVSPPDSAEGALVSVPLVLESDGSVGGLTFALHYDADLLSSPEVVWDASLSNGLQQANVPVLGQVRGVFALNGTVVPAGTQTLAVVNFRARTVLTNSTSEFLLDIVDVADVSGGLLAFGNDVRNGSATVIAGPGLVGDNNGNGRLDIGDVSLLLRLLAQLDSTRPWDLTQNDLNTNSLIDSGDAIRILLAAAAIESPAGLSRAKVDGVPDVNLEMGLVSPTVARGSNGLVTYQVRLQNVRGLVSGAAFTLSYPTAALRIADPQSLGVGAMVPLGSAVAWNVSPTNNYAQQNGHVRFVVSSAAAWASRAGVLAQITFQVQPGATNQYAWPLTLSSMEITSLGYNRPLLPGGALFASRDPQPALLGGITRLTNGILQFNIAGDAQATLAIDASIDLVHWITLTNIINAAGTVPFNDPDAAGLPRRFYRVRAFAP